MAIPVGHLAVFSVGITLRVRVRKVTHENLIRFSFVVNSSTWILWLFVLRHFRDWQLEIFLDYSCLAFFASATLHWLIDRYRKNRINIDDLEWPLASLLIHMTPLFTLVAYMTYFDFEGKEDVRWALMFLAPTLAGMDLARSANYFMKN